MYDEIALSYNKLHKEEQLKKLKIISKILKVKKENFLLDLGAGTGISTNYFKCKSFGIEEPTNFPTRASFTKIVVRGIKSFGCKN